MDKIPYILAYKSLSRISRALKIESVCGPKSMTHLKSQVAFEDLYWMQASLNRLCARAAVYSVVEIGDRRQGQSPRGGGASA